MKIGIWNIELPEQHPRSARRMQRLADIQAYLQQQDCDALILLEANAALQLPGYEAGFSAESPFRSKKLCYDPPNRYHQVAIYSKFPLEMVPIVEPVNGLLCRLTWEEQLLLLYGNVITIKDQWHPYSHKKYSDRLAEQLALFGQMAGARFLIGGDFNLRRGWPQKKEAYRQMAEYVAEQGWKWPTADQAETVQHFLHSPDLQCRHQVDFSVRHSPGRKDRLSDHPFVVVEIVSTFR